MQIETMVEGTTLGYQWVIKYKGTQGQICNKKIDVTKRVNPAVMNLSFAEWRTARSRFIALYR